VNMPPQFLAKQERGMLRHYLTINRQYTKLSADCKNAVNDA
jgi:hypothetical protein